MANKNGLQPHLSRRDFLKIAGGIAGAGSLLVAKHELGKLNSVGDFIEGLSPTDEIMTPGKVLEWIRPISVKVGLFTIAGAAYDAYAYLKSGKEKLEVGDLKGTVAGAGVDTLTGCSPKPSGEPPTATQIANVEAQATALPTEISPLTGQTPPALEAVPVEATAIPNQFPSVVDGLNIGEVSPGNPIGMVPGYETTGINTLYDPNDPPTTITKPNGEEVEAIPPRAFGIDQDQLKKLFNAQEIKNEKGEVIEINGTNLEGAAITLKNGVWTASTGEVFIPFIKAEPNTDAIYLVMDVNNKLQKVDKNGKPIEAPMPMFDQPSEIAKRMGFKKANQVIDVEMNKNGSLNFITKESRPTKNKPDRTVQIVNEVAFLGGVEDLNSSKAAETATTAFVGALAGAGITITVEEIKKKGFTVMRVEEPDSTDPTKQKKNSYDIATITVGDENGSGDYALLIKNEKGEWREILLRDSKGLPIGTTVDLGDSDHTSNKYIKSAKEFGFIVPSGGFWEQYWQFKGASTWTTFAKSNNSGLRIQQVIYPNIDTPKDLKSDKESVLSYIQMRNKKMIPYLSQMKGRNVQIVLVNEPFWINGSKMTWSGENGNGNPLYSAFGKEWVTEAYVDLYNQTIAAGLVPGKDFTIIGINQGGLESSGSNADFVISEINTIKKSISNRLNIPISEIPFDLGIQFHLGKRKGDRNAVLPLPINVNAVVENFNNIYNQSGSAIHITEVDSIEDEMITAQGYHDLISAAKQSTAVADLNFWGTMSFPDASSSWQNPLVKSDYSRTISYYKVLQALFSD